MKQTARKKNVLRRIEHQPFKTRVGENRDGGGQNLNNGKEKTLQMQFWEG